MLYMSLLAGVVTSWCWSLFFSFLDGV